MFGIEALDALFYREAQQKKGQFIVCTQIIEIKRFDVITATWDKTDRLFMNQSNKRFADRCWT